MSLVENKVANSEKIAIMVSKKLDIQKELADEIMRGYWLQVKKTLANPEKDCIRLYKIGTFYLYPFALIRAVRRDIIILKILREKIREGIYVNMIRKIFIENRLRENWKLKSKMRFRNTDENWTYVSGIGYIIKKSKGEHVRKKNEANGIFRTSIQGS